MSLDNRVALITGATGTLGRVVSKSLGSQGARLVLKGRNLDTLNEAAAQLDLPNDRILKCVFEASKKEDADEAIRLAKEKFGGVDILIHLVGGWVGGQPLVNSSHKDVEDMLQQHLWSTLYLTQAFLPQALQNGWGRIIIVSSTVAVNPKANSGPYAIGKTAQETVIRTVAQETKGKGVTANILQINMIDSKHERENNPSLENASWTTPEEIAAAILYLCSPEAGMVNGARIPLYGSA